MRYAGWYPRRRGILEHLDNGAISLLDSAIHDFLCLIADYRTGVAWASAEKIRALCPSDITLRAIQRSLAHLNAIGWIKRFRTHGRRGNYPIVVGKFRVISVTDGITDASPRWMSINLESTIDWRNVQFDPVTEPSLSEEVRCHSRVTERDTDVSPIQELRSETSRAKSTRCSLHCDSGWQFIGVSKTGSREFQAIFDEAFVDYKNESDVCAKKSECSCCRVAFLETALDACKGQRVRYPSGLLVLKKRLESEKG